MSGKVKVIVALVIIAVIAAIVLFVVNPFSGNGSGESQQPVQITNIQPPSDDTSSSDTSSIEPEATEKVEVNTEPVACDYESAIALIKKITTSYSYDEFGWNKLVEDAKMISLELDEESISPAFFQYSTADELRKPVFASVNISSEFRRVSDINADKKEYQIFVSLRRGIAGMPNDGKITRDDVVQNVKNNLLKANDPSYDANLVYTLTIENGVGRVVLNTPNWYQDDATASEEYAAQFADENYVPEGAEGNFAEEDKQHGVESTNTAADKTE